MKRQLLIYAFLLWAQAAEASVITTLVEDSIVQPGGVRTTNGGTTLVDYFFNAEGSSNNSFASFAPVDFSVPSGAHILSTGVTLTLKLTEDNAAFTTPGMLDILLATDTTTNIGLGSPLAFQTSSLPHGVGTQLNNPAVLGSFSFPTSGNVNSGQVDTITLTPTGAQLTYLVNQVNTNGDIRLVLAPADANVAATYGGIGNSSFAGPQLTITDSSDAVPEPATVFLSLVGIVSVLLLKR